MPSYNKTGFILNKLKAFSMVEVLLSILIISVLIALAVPVISKKDHSTTSRQEQDSRRFLYRATGEENEFPCYVTRFDDDGDGIEVIDDGSGNCAEYTFTVPRGVNLINLTLVAGGGGGGGAAGGYFDKREIISNKAPIIDGIPQTRIDDITINLMTGAGASGKNMANTTPGKITSGAGGASGAAIIDYSIPKRLIRTGYIPNFMNEFASLEYYGTNWASGMVQLGFVESMDGLYTAPYFNATGETHANGPGFLIRKADYTLRESEQFHVYVSDADALNPFYSNADCMQLVHTNWGANFSMTADISKMNNAQELCGLNKGNFYPSEEGSDGTSVGSSDFSGNIHTGQRIEGGAGGKISSISGRMGAGGKGQSIILKCPNNTNTCSFGSINVNSPTSNSYILEDPEIIYTDFGSTNRYGRATLTLKHPGGAAAGGAGGSAVRVNNFQVIPGETLTVVVGKGGAGGNKGAEGEARRNDDGSATVVKTAKRGGNGMGGSASAIYDEDGNLLLMVAGGIGGIGGFINENIETANNAPNPPAISATRYEALVFSNSQRVNLNNLIYDDRIVASVQNDVNNTTAQGIGDMRRIVYSFIQNESYPLFELDTNNPAIGRSEDVETNNTYDRQTGGFSAYNLNIAPDIDELFFAPDVTYKGEHSDIRNTDNTSAGNVYNGFNAKYAATRKDAAGGLQYAPNDDLMYAGGLGGFSGLGTKAGCGGLFVGNLEGINTNAAAGGFSYADDYAGTFSIKTVNGDDRTFKIEDYYANCSAYTSDGHSADFVAPSFSEGLAITFGSAGAGGGGGGWSATFGPGQGGDGQNGYVMLDWLK